MENKQEILDKLLLACRQPGYSVTWQAWNMIRKQKW